MTRWWLMLALVAGLERSPARAAEQAEVHEGTPAAQPATEPALADVAPSAAKSPPGGRHWSDVVKIGENFVLEEGETASDVVVIAGNAVIKGRVTGDFVVVMGNADIQGPLGHDMVVVMGSAELGPKAEVKGDAVVVGGRMHVHPDAQIRGDRRDIAFAGLFPDLGWLRDWVRHGIMMIRPLPPQVGWAWALAGLCALVYLICTLVFARPVQACVFELHTRPIVAFFTGILGFILVGPLMLVLVASVVGLLAIPFVACAALGVIVFGRAAVYAFTGQQLARATGVEVLQKLPLALLLGIVPFLLLYTIPVLGFLVWGAVLPLGVGAALLALVNSFRRETNPRSPSTYTGPGGPMGVGLGLAPVEGPSGTAGFDAGNAGVGAAPPPPLTGAAMNAEAARLPRAGFWIRACATFLDAILVFWLASFFGPLVMVLWVAYHVAMWMWKGTTVGGIVLGLKVVRLDGRPVDFATALVRSLSGFFSAIVLGLGFFWVGWDPERQSWHDRIAGTTIVRLPRGMSLI